jgi:hypothetical protein
MATCKQAFYWICCNTRIEVRCAASCHSNAPPHLHVHAPVRGSAEERMPGTRPPPARACRPAPQEDGKVIAPSSVVAARRSVEFARRSVEVARAEAPRAKPKEEAQAGEHTALISADAGPADDHEQPLAAPQPQPADLRGAQAAESMLSRDVAANLSAGADLLARWAAPMMPPARRPVHIVMMTGWRLETHGNCLACCCRP